jgi:hypothetical protein
VLCRRMACSLQQTVPFSKLLERKLQNMLVKLYAFLCYPPSIGYIHIDIFIVKRSALGSVALDKMTYLRHRQKVRLMNRKALRGRWKGSVASEGTKRRAHHSVPSAFCERMAIYADHLRATLPEASNI